MVTSEEEGDEVLLVLIECIADTIKQMNILYHQQSHFEGGLTPVQYVNQKTNAYVSLCEQRLKSIWEEVI